MEPLKEALPDFSGQTVLFYIAGFNPDDGLYLVDPHFEIQGGKLFVTGTLPESKTPISGNCVAVAWDSVTAYIVAESIDHFDPPSHDW